MTTDPLEAAAAEIRHIAQYLHTLNDPEARKEIADILRKHLPTCPRKVLAIFWTENDGSRTRLAAVEWSGEFIDKTLKRYAEEYAFDPEKLSGTIFEVVPLKPVPAAPTKQESDDAE